MGNPCEEQTCVQCDSSTCESCVVNSNCGWCEATMSCYIKDDFLDCPSGIWTGHCGVCTNNSCAGCTDCSQCSLARMSAFGGANCDGWCEISQACILNSEYQSECPKGTLYVDGCVFEGQSSTCNSSCSGCRNCVECSQVTGIDYDGYCQWSVCTQSCVSVNPRICSDNPHVACTIAGVSCEDTYNSCPCTEASSLTSKQFGYNSAFFGCLGAHASSSCLDNCFSCASCMDCTAREGCGWCEELQLCSPVGEPCLANASQCICDNTCGSCGDCASCIDQGCSWCTGGAEDGVMLAPHCVNMNWTQSNTSFCHNNSLICESTDTCSSDNCDGCSCYDCMLLESCGWCSDSMQCSQFGNPCRGVPSCDLADFSYSDAAIMCPLAVDSEKLSTGNVNIPQWLLNVSDYTKKPLVMPVKTMANISCFRNLANPYRHKAAIIAILTTQIILYIFVVVCANCYRGYLDDPDTSDNCVGGDCKSKFMFGLKIRKVRIGIAVVFIACGIGFIVHAYAPSCVQTNNCVYGLPRYHDSLKPQICLFDTKSASCVAPNSDPVSGIRQADLIGNDQQCNVYTLDGANPSSSSDGFYVTGNYEGSFEEKGEGEGEGEICPTNWNFCNSSKNFLQKLALSRSCYTTRTVSELPAKSPWFQLGALAVFAGIISVLKNWDRYVLVVCAASSMVSYGFNFSPFPQFRAGMIDDFPFSVVGPFFSQLYLFFVWGRQGVLHMQSTPRLLQVGKTLGVLLQIIFGTMGYFGNVVLFILGMLNAWVVTEFLYLQQQDLSDEDANRELSGLNTFTFTISFVLYFAHSYPFGKQNVNFCLLGSLYLARAVLFQSVSSVKRVADRVLQVGELPDAFNSHNVDESKVSSWFSKLKKYLNWSKLQAWWKVSVPRKLYLLYRLLLGDWKFRTVNVIFSNIGTLLYFAATPGLWAHNTYRLCACAVILSALLILVSVLTILTRFSQLQKLRKWLPIDENFRITIVLKSSLLIVKLAVLEQGRRNFLGFSIGADVGLYILTTYNILIIFVSTAMDARQFWKNPEKLPIGHARLFVVLYYVRLIWAQVTIVVLTALSDAQGLQSLLGGSPAIHYCPPPSNLHGISTLGGLLMVGESEERGYLNQCLFRLLGPLLLLYSIVNYQVRFFIIYCVQRD